MMFKASKTTLENELPIHVITECYRNTYFTTYST